MDRFFIRCIFGVTFITGLILLGATMAVPSQAQGAPSQTPAPLALIDENGNVVLTNTDQAGSSVNITHNGTLVSEGEGGGGGSDTVNHKYSKPRWSPDGTLFAFVDTDTGNLFVATRTGAKRLITQIPRSLENTVLINSYADQITWSRDSQSVIYLSDNQADPNVTTQFHLTFTSIKIDGSGAHTLGTFAVQNDCGPYDHIPYGARETGYGNNVPSFVSTQFGLLVTTTCTGNGLALLTSTGQIIWRDAELARAVASPDGLSAVAISYDLQQGVTGDVVTLDLMNGHYTRISGAAHADQLGWSADGQTIFYSSISGDWITLSKIPIQGGQPISLFVDQGNHIGDITASPDLQHLAFSFISDSNFGSGITSAILEIPLNNVDISTPANIKTARFITNGEQPRYVQRPVAPIVLDASAFYKENFYLGATSVPVTDAYVPVGNTVQRINLDNVSTKAVSGQSSFNGYRTPDRWVVSLTAGELFNAQAKFTSDIAALSIYGADGTVLQSFQDNALTYVGIIPRTQDYFIKVRDSIQYGGQYVLSLTTSPIFQPIGLNRNSVPAFPQSAKDMSIHRLTFSVPSSIILTSGGHYVVNLRAGQYISIDSSGGDYGDSWIVYGADGAITGKKGERFVGIQPLMDSRGNNLIPTTEDYFIDIYNLFSQIKVSVGQEPVNATTIQAPPLPAPAPFPVKRIDLTSVTKSAAIIGAVYTNDPDHWVIHVQAGQVLTVVADYLNSTNPYYSLSVEIIGEDGKILQSGSDEQSSFKGVIPVTQDCQINVLGGYGGSGLNSTYPSSVIYKMYVEVS